MLCLIKVSVFSIISQSFLCIALVIFQYCLSIVFALAYSSLRIHCHVSTWSQSRLRINSVLTQTPLQTTLKNRIFQYFLNKNAVFYPLANSSLSRPILFQIVHKWSPCHREVLKRSHVDKTILLLQIGNRYVPIVETAVKMVDLEAENEAANGVVVPWF